MENMQTESKCPNCGSQLKYDPESKCLKCVSCSSLFDIESLGQGDLDNEEQQMLKDHLCSNCLCYEA